MKDYTKTYSKYSKSGTLHFHSNHQNRYLDHECCDQKFFLQDIQLQVIPDTGGEKVRTKIIYPKELENKQ